MWKRSSRGGNSSRMESNEKCKSDDSREKYIEEKGLRVVMGI